MCISDIEHQFSRVSQVLREVAVPRRCVGNFPASGMDFRNRTTFSTAVFQRNRNAEVSLRFLK